ncbi:MAG: hypothetical protein ACJ8F7_11390 [Gemmataceae bacterium]
MTHRKRQDARLSVEALEAREVPAAPWQVQDFEQSTLGALPTGWAQHDSDPATTFLTTAPQLGSGNGLQTAGSSASESRAWLNTAVPPDARVSASVYLDSLIPAEVIARGQNLDTDTPTYYAVAVSRGLQVQLLRVVDGQATVLQTLDSGDWMSGQWVRVSLTTVGNSLSVQLFRGDTAQYLNANGKWQANPADAITMQDGAIAAGGFAGVGRPASYAGPIHFDNFEVAPPPADQPHKTLVEETFGKPVPGGLPAGWVQWTPGTANFQVSPALTLTGDGGLTLANPTTDEIRAWLDKALPADVDVSSALYLGNIGPAQIIARGQDLGTATPSYYAVNVIRGMQLQLIRVADGQTTVLQTLKSQQWLSNQWLQVRLSLQGDDLRVAAYRTDTGEYLAPDGSWQAAPAWALGAHDGAIAGPGRVGVGRAAGPATSVTFDNIVVSQAVTTPTTPSPTDQWNFDSAAVGTMPDGWSQSSNNQAPGFQVTDQAAASGAQSLMSLGGSDTESRAWLMQPQGADVQVGANVFLDSLVPAQLIVRGQNLDTATPTYYAVSIARGVDVQVQRVVNGQTTVLAEQGSNSWDSGIWAHVQLIVQGDVLQVQITRADTGQYLNENGDWQTDPATVITVADDAISGGGLVGVGRPASYSGRLLFDDFSVDSTANLPPPVSPPPVTPPGGTTTGGSTPPPVTPPTTTPPGETGGPTPTPIPLPPDLPPVPRHYTHIRIAELAYSGTPMGSLEQNLLQNSVDLVIPSTTLLNQISATSPNTPTFIYSNASNVYRELLTDWLNWADAHGVSREAAFYHVTQATPFTGDSASSWPVRWFWSVQTGSDSRMLDVTSLARSQSQQNITFGAAGESVVVGNTEKFREINFNLVSGASAGWTGVLEYASAVDANGNPTAWTTLRTLSDRTNGLTRSGRVTFDPPADWQTAAVGNNPARLYYVRVRTLTDGTAPVAGTILGRDYVNANGTAHGTIPAFDSSADANHDGYLSDAEYAKRQPGMDARFAYESRAFYPAYGQNRFATNVADAHFQAWAADYTFRYLQANPSATGVFLDNSLSKISFDPKTIAESLDGYADHYADLLAKINQKIAPNWVLANVAGGGVAVDALAKRDVSYLEEVAIRPMAASYSQFEDVASNLARRLSLSGGKSYAILDSLATGDQAVSARWQLGTLAYYYLLADPNQTMLMFNGGNEPSSTWARHWSPAAQFNVGQPQGSWSVFATGKDPSNATMTYKVYERQYSNALILYKPLSYYRGVAGTTTDRTATTHDLGGTYRPLNADGTLGAPITRITLRNGEGAILVKV